MEGGNQPMVPVAAVSGMEAAHKFYQEQVQLPSSLRNTEPRWCGSKLARLFFDTILPTLGIKWVDMKMVEVDGKPIYHIRASVFFTTTHIYVNPVAAYFIGNALHTMFAMRGSLPSLSFHGDKETMGSIYIPRWAAVPILYKLAEVCEQHKHSIALAVAEVDRLGAAKQDDEDGGIPFEPPATAQRTIH